MKLNNEEKTLLRNVRADIAAGKWTTGRFHDGKGNYCLSGHLIVNYRDVPIYTGERVQEAILDVLVEKGWERNIPGFNDNSTREEVVELLGEVLAHS